MKNQEDNNANVLTEHFFRNEYGKLVSVVTRYLGTHHVETAEDIVQETLLKAVDHWQQNGIPKNPQAWLYTTAKNHTLNILKRKKHQISKWPINPEQADNELKEFITSNDVIDDEQLKMMFVCCHPSISENSQVTLILKILCGFSITEIANAFFTTTETINKRLVRGRKQLKDAKITFSIPKDIGNSLDIVLKTIYLLFNEGYSPSQQNKIIRKDLCLEAIRLVELLAHNSAIKQKSKVHALLALMYLNASRFEARIKNGILVEMHKQDRKLWNLSLMNTGIRYLNQTTKEDSVSEYQILATISGYYCVSPSFEKINWKAILHLYDHLLTLQDTPLIRLNRCIPLAKVEGNTKAITELINLNHNSDIENHYLYHATLSELYIQEKNNNDAREHLLKAIKHCSNNRDIHQLEKKLKKLVPIH